MPLHLLNNKKMLSEIEETLKRTLDKITRLGGQRTETQNPQIIYMEGKKKMVETIRRFARKSIPVKKARLEELQARIGMVLIDKTLSEDDRLMTAALLQQKIEELQNEVNMGRRTAGMIRAKLEMETVSKYWMNIGKSKAPQDTIQELRDTRTNPPTYVQRSDGMARVAKEFYEDLQKADAYPKITTEEKCRIKQSVIENFDVNMPAESKTMLARLLTNEDIIEALRSTASGKAAGIDGLLYELWKTLYERFVHLDDGVQRANIIDIF